MKKVGRHCGLRGLFVRMCVARAGRGPGKCERVFSYTNPFTVSLWQTAGLTLRLDSGTGGTPVFWLFQPDRRDAGPTQTEPDSHSGFIYPEIAIGGRGGEKGSAVMLPSR